MVGEVRRGWRNETVDDDEDRAGREFEEKGGDDKREEKWRK